MKQGLEDKNDNCHPPQSRLRNITQRAGDHSRVSTEPVVIEYLKSGWTRGQLLALFAAADLSPSDALRTTKSPAQELGLLDPAIADEVVLDAMLDHPVLVNRPIVRSPKGVRLCRPSQTVLYLLDTMPPRPFFKEDGQMIVNEKGERVD